MSDTAPRPYLTLAMPDGRAVTVAEAEVIFTELLRVWAPLRTRAGVSGETARTTAGLCELGLALCELVQELAGAPHAS